LSISYIIVTNAALHSTAGTDIKSIFINFSSFVLIVLPVACYVYQDYAKHLVAGVVASFAVAFLLPPSGWKRPHPYSDNPNNLPYPRKAD